MIGSEMYDEGFQNSNSDEEDKNQEFEFGQEDEVQYNQPEDLEYPNIDSPKVTKDMQKNRTLIYNKKIDSDGECSFEPEESPEIPNESSPLELKRKQSSNLSQNDYEVIGENSVRETITLRKMDSENKKDNIGNKKSQIYNSDSIKSARTDKGYSEISQMKKKNLSVLVSY